MRLAWLAAVIVIGLLLAAILFGGGKPRSGEVLSSFRAWDLAPELVISLVVVVVLLVEAFAR